MFVFLKMNQRILKLLGQFDLPRRPHPQENSVLRLALREEDLIPSIEPVPEEVSIKMRVVELRRYAVDPLRIAYGYAWVLENAEFLEDFIKQYMISDEIRV